jgi:hypothetical protein
MDIITKTASNWIFSIEYLPAALRIKLRCFRTLLMGFNWKPSSTEAAWNSDVSEKALLKTRSGLSLVSISWPVNY